MKRMLRIYFWSTIILIFLIQAFSFAEVPIVNLKMQDTRQILKNGDRVSITASGFPTDDQVVAAVLIIYDENGEVEYKIQENYNLRIDIFGNLSGEIILSGLDIDDRSALVGVSTKKSTIIPTKAVKVEGGLPELPKPESLGSIFTFVDDRTDGDSIVSTSELLNIETSDNTWTGGTIDVLLCFQREYSTIDGSGTPIAFAMLATGGLSISPDANGALSGTTTSSSTFNGSTQSLRLDIMDNTGQFALSSNFFSTIADSDPPGLSTATGIDLDTLVLVFDEPVMEVGGGDAAAMFDLTPGTISATAIIPVSGEVTDTWYLVISGLDDRGLQNVTVAYDRDNNINGSTTLNDPAYNEVETTLDPVEPDDAIPPAATELRDSSNTVLMHVGEFLGDGHRFNARVILGAQDNSLAGVEFQGNDDTTPPWDEIYTQTSGTTVGSDVYFSYDWTTPTEYRVFRARAFDDQGNETFSAIVGSLPNGFNNNFGDTYRAAIREVTPDPVGASSGALRSEVVVEIQNNFGNPINSAGQGFTFYVSETSTTTELWWDNATGPPSSSTEIDLSISSSATEGSVWYSNETVGGPNTLVLTEPAGNFAGHYGEVTANGQTITVITSNIVNVSSPDPAVDSNIDTTASAGDLPVQINIDGGEDPAVSDDFRIFWGFSNDAGATSSTITKQDMSIDLSPGGGFLSYTVPVSDLQDLGLPDPYDYMFFWVENISLDPLATIIDGFPIGSSPARLIINPNLQTAAGENGADVAGGPFTPGVEDQEVVSIQFSTNPSQGTIQISGLVFDITATSTVTASDIDAFHLYLDGGVKGTYEPALDVELDNVTYSGGNAVNFNGISPPQSVSTAVHVLVTVDVASGANPSSTLGLLLVSPDRITVNDNVENGPASSINIDDFSNIGTSEDYSLPVTLSSFQAKAGYGKIILQWTTASEENNAGFYVMRAEEENGQYIQLNVVIIEGHGNTTVEHHYRYEDTNLEIGKTYYYNLYSVDFNGDLFQYPFAESAMAMAIPETFALKQNFPNPFNPATKISFAVPQESQVKLEIYNMLGQKVRTLLDDRMEPGVYENVIWDAKDDSGNLLTNGIYYLVLISSDQGFKQVKKMVFMK